MSEDWNDIDVDWTGYPMNRVEGVGLGIEGDGYAIDLNPIRL